MIISRAKAFMMPYAKSAMNAARVNTPGKKIATKYSHKSTPPMYGRTCTESGLKTVAAIVYALNAVMKHFSFMEGKDAKAIFAPTAARI